MAYRLWGFQLGKLVFGFRNRLCGGKRCEHFACGGGLGFLQDLLVTVNPHALQPLGGFDLGVQDFFRRRSIQPTHGFALVGIYGGMKIY